MKRLIWKCNLCDDVVVSYSRLRHQMNWCDCGKTAVDYEEEYSRGVGDPRTISEKIKIKEKWVKVT